MTYQSPWWVRRRACRACAICNSLHWLRVLGVGRPPARLVGNAVSARGPTADGRRVGSRRIHALLCSQRNHPPTQDCIPATCTWPPQSALRSRYPCPGCALSLRLPAHQAKPCFALPPQGLVGSTFSRGSSSQSSSDSLPAGVTRGNPNTGREASGSAASRAQFVAANETVSVELAQLRTRFFDFELLQNDADKVGPPIHPHPMLRRGTHAARVPAWRGAPAWVRYARPPARIPRPYPRC